MSLRAQLLKRCAWLLHLIGDEVPPSARDNSAVARALSRRCYLHTGNGGLSWCLTSSLSLSVPQGARYHADAIYSIHQQGIKKAKTPRKAYTSAVLNRLSLQPFSR